MSRIAVCSYTPGGSLTTGAAALLTLTGEKATTLADSLENASKTKPTQACPTLRLANQRSLAIIATTRDGTTLPTVTTTLDEVACAVTVSNGTALRYAWTPPASLQDEFAQLVPSDTGTRPSIAPQSRVHGSPISS